MKKILFDDKYGLTKAVLEGRKTMTRRRIVPPRTMEGKDVYGFAVVKYPRTNQPIEVMALDADGAQIGNILPKYKVGEVVAVAQKYCDCRWNPNILQQAFVKKPTVFPDLDPYSPLMGWVDLPMKYHKGWDNKMFVLADLMPHQIRITNIRVERLQNISDEDCIREGIERIYYGDEEWFKAYDTKDGCKGAPTPKEAFAALIDKVSEKGTWESNPWVFVYEFELVK